MHRNYTFSCFRLLTILSSPLNAPDATNRMLVVSTCTASPLNFLVLLSGTFTMVPSRSLSMPCCTPSPPTSLSWWMPGTEPILSTSSRNTMPAGYRENNQCITLKNTHTVSQAYRENNQCITLKKTHTVR